MVFVGALLVVLFGTEGLLVLDKLRASEAGERDMVNGTSVRY
jgi:hypothetical protein